MKRGKLIVVSVVMLALPLGCSMVDEQEVEVAPTMEAQKALARQASLVDNEGRTWLRRGEVTFKDVSLAELKVDGLPDARSIDIAELPLEEAARLLAPRMEFGGVEFALDEPSAMDFARVIQAVAIESRERDARGESGAPGKSTSPPARLGKARQRPSLAPTTEATSTIWPTITRTMFTAGAAQPLTHGVPASS
ncbi:MAG: hypothetical protein KF894_26770 [Labilithrix sp.]|nr:hypothetical protein [Labilithrix sp.]